MNWWYRLAPVAILGVLGCPLAVRLEGAINVNIFHRQLACIVGCTESGPVIEANLWYRPNQDQFIGTDSSQLSVRFGPKELCQ